MNQKVSPSATLKAEHQVILRVVRVLAHIMDHFEQTGEFAETALVKCVEFIRLYADACHHGKEEDLLFPVLESCGVPREGGPIGVMIHEHRMARELTKEMVDALSSISDGNDHAHTQFLEAARQYITLLTNHIFKEDNILFNMGDRVMAPGDKSTLTSQFCDVNCRLFEGKKREQLERIAEELGAEWGIG